MHEHFHAELRRADVDHSPGELPCQPLHAQWELF
jgi:hypothetical protein